MAAGLRSESTQPNEAQDAQDLICSQRRTCYAAKADPQSPQESKLFLSEMLPALVALRDGCKHSVPLQHSTEHFLASLSGQERSCVKSHPLSANISFKHNWKRESSMI